MVLFKPYLHFMWPLTWHRIIELNERAKATANAVYEMLQCRLLVLDRAEKDALLETLFAMLADHITGGSICLV